MRRQIPAVLVALVLVSGAFWLVNSPSRRLTAASDGKVWSTPPATVFHEDYEGAPATGRNLTSVPNLARLEPGNRTHDVRIDIVAAEVEIAPDVRYVAWTFGGSVPGPVLHVREGDRVVFTMKNRTDKPTSITPPMSDASPYLAALVANNIQKPTPAALPLPHSMDFHAGTVAPNDKWRMIMPGESIRFEWVANYPGVYLYHCGAAPILMHLSMGQYGVVVVSPRNGYPTDRDIRREYVVVQSEFYLAPAEGTGLHVYDSSAAEGKRPSHVAFNGHTMALRESPIVANAGERVRLYVHNAGPSDTSSFHVVGAIFDKVFYEGNPLNESSGMQTVVLGASNGAVVEFIAPEAGTYILVDHEFADANRGAVGLMTVRTPSGDVLPATATAEMSH